MNAACPIVSSLCSASPEENVLAEQLIWGFPSIIYCLFPLSELRAVRIPWRAAPRSSPPSLAQWGPANNPRGSLEGTDASWVCFLCLSVCLPSCRPVCLSACLSLCLSWHYNSLSSPSPSSFKGPSSSPWPGEYASGLWAGGGEAFEGRRDTQVTKVSIQLVTVRWLDSKPRF